MVISTSDGAAERFLIERVDGFSPQRATAERELVVYGVRLPVSQRADWQRVHGAVDSILLIARDSSNAPVAAVSASITRTRALPRHRLYRVDRWVGSGIDSADRSLIVALAKVARRDFLCLRVSVDLFSLEPSQRQQRAAQLGVLGFQSSTTPRMYSETLTIDLSQSEDALLAQIHSTARKNIRALAKKGLVVRSVDDTAFGDRLTLLFDETFRRTGGKTSRLPWGRIIELSREQRSVSHVVGVFDETVSGAESLIAFAWGTAHGDFATYEAGASIRRPDLGNTPLSYAPLWELITWAKRETRARTFDLGGVTSGDESDPRHGITRFKRYFSETQCDVGEEWTMEPAPLRAALARAISRGVRRTPAFGIRLDEAGTEPAKPSPAGGAPIPINPSRGS